MSPNYTNSIPPYKPPSASEKKKTLPTLGADPEDTTPSESQAERVFVPTQIPIQNDINYTQGYLATKIGKFVRVEFLLGTNTLIDRSGVLERVGISFIVLRETGTGNEIVCDIYSIKFVTVFEERTT